MKKLLQTLVLVMATAASIAPAFASGSGRCINPWDTAADGSRCGDRSSTSRPGGR